MFCSIHKNVLGIRIDYLEKYLGLTLLELCSVLRRTIEEMGNCILKNGLEKWKY